MSFFATKCYKEMLIKINLYECLIHAFPIFLKRGGFWIQQGHIYKKPFYYIDYTLAQVCALQFWVKDRADHKTAWEDYLRLWDSLHVDLFLKSFEAC